MIILLALGQVKTDRKEEGWCETLSNGGVHGSLICLLLFLGIKQPMAMYILRSAQK